MVNEVAAQAAIALLLLTEETRFRKLLIVADLREKRERVRNVRAVRDAGDER